MSEKDLPHAFLKMKCKDNANNKIDKIINLNAEV
jgi:hypothetical protein